MSEYIDLDALVIAAHPDDAELGMAGAIMMMLASGKKVGILDLTNGEPTPHGTPELRQQETDAASKVMGISWRMNLGLTNRKLEADLESRAKLAGVIRQTRPRWLFAPFWIDAHPDHAAATKLVDDARFWAKLTKSELDGEPFHPERIYNYYCVHLKMHPNPAFVLDISEYWERKQAAISCFESQFVTGREHLDPSFIESLRIEAAYWGKTIGVKYGEPFNCREPLALGDLNGLK